MIGRADTTAGSWLPAINASTISNCQCASRGPASASTEHFDSEGLDQCPSTRKGVRSESKNTARRIKAGAVICIAAVVGSASVALAGAAPGTDGAGYTYFPTSSPYISYAVVTKCLGKPGGAMIVRSKATLATDIAYGPVSVWGFDPSSTVTLRKIGSYYGNWYCLNLG